MSATALTVAETGEPLCLVVRAAHDIASAKGLASGLLIGGTTTSQGALSQLGSGLLLIEQAAREGAGPDAITAYVTSLEREAATLLGRLVKIRLDATAISASEAA